MLTSLTFGEVYHVVCNMREKDAVEIYNLRPHDNELQLAYEAHHLIANSGRGVCSWHRGKPAAVAAFTESWPGCWEVWMFGTEDFAQAVWPLLKWVRTEAKSLIDDCGANRLQCDSRADYLESHKLIQGLGGTQEAYLRRYGKDGSDYIRFSWINGECDAVLEAGFQTVSVA
tara:strand:- start:216 stop:731 length:516 start_codon:yes stop_codon:yes gene_type:complete